MSTKLLLLPSQEQRIKLLEIEVQELREALLQLERKQRYPTFLSIKELTDMLPVSERTVYDWVSRGLIPYHKAGDCTVFLPTSRTAEQFKPCRGRARTSVKFTSQGKEARPSRASLNLSLQLLTGSGSGTST